MRLFGSDATQIIKLLLLPWDFERRNIVYKQNNIAAYQSALRKGFTHFLRPAVHYIEKATAEHFYPTGDIEVFCVCRFLIKEAYIVTLHLNQFNI